MEKKKSKINPYVKLALKLALSGVAMYIVFSKVDFTTVWELVRESNPFWLIFAFVLFNLSKIFSAHRLRALLGAIDISIDYVHNLKLCYVGMFYNLFLPGSVGGDGYKVVYLNKRYSTRLKLLVATVLLDRISGAAILLAMALGFGVFVTPFFDFFPHYANAVMVLLAVLAIPVLFLVIRFVFPSFRSAGIPVVGWSISVQGVQVICAYAILRAFGVNDFFTTYFVLFLVSSLASMLPLSFGGVGLRELVFVYSSQYLPIDETPAVALGLMYFLIIAASSFIGIFVKLPEPAPVPEVLQKSASA